MGGGSVNGGGSSIGVGRGYKYVGGGISGDVYDGAISFGGGSRSVSGNGGGGGGIRLANRFRCASAKYLFGLNMQMRLEAFQSPPRSLLHLFH